MNFLPMLYVIRSVGPHGAEANCKDDTVGIAEFEELQKENSHS
jgi:hypothetical protein